MRYKPTTSASGGLVLRQRFGPPGRACQQHMLDCASQGQVHGELGQPAQETGGRYPGTPDMLLTPAGRSQAWSYEVLSGQDAVTVM